MYHAGHVVCAAPEEADVVLCMSVHHARNRDDFWKRIAALGKPVVVGRAGPGDGTDAGILRAVEPGVRHHFVAHAGLAERTRDAAQREFGDSIRVAHVPKCYDLVDEAVRRFRVGRPLAAPITDSGGLVDIISLIHKYDEYWKPGFAQFERIREILPHVRWHGVNSPWGTVNDVDALARARFLVHIKNGGCVDNAPARAVACGVPVLTTRDSVHSTLTDEIVLHGVSGYIGADAEELIDFVRGLSPREYDMLRESTWEYGRRYREIPADSIERFNALLDDALGSGATAADYLPRRDTIGRRREIRRSLPGHDRRLRRSRLVLLSKRGGVLRARHLLTGGVCDMNETMALVFRLCDGRRTLAEIVDQLYEAFSKLPDRPAYAEFAKDIQSALATLRAYGLVRWLA